VLRKGGGGRKEEEAGDISVEQPASGIKMILNFAKLVKTAVLLEYSF
jgi:hypothetical protein